MINTLSDVLGRAATSYTESNDTTQKVWKLAFERAEKDGDVTTLVELASSSAASDEQIKGLLTHRRGEVRAKALTSRSWDESIISEVLLREKAADVLATIMGHDLPPAVLLSLTENPKVAVMVALLEKGKENLRKSPQAWANVIAFHTANPRVSKLSQKTSRQLQNHLSVLSSEVLERLDVTLIPEGYRVCLLSNKNLTDDLQTASALLAVSECLKGYRSWNFTDYFTNWTKNVVDGKLELGVHSQSSLMAVEKVITARHSSNPALVEPLELVRMSPSLRQGRLDEIAAQVQADKEAKDEAGRGRELARGTDNPAEVWQSVRLAPKNVQVAVATVLAVRDDTPLETLIEVFAFMPVDRMSEATGMLNKRFDGAWESEDAEAALTALCAAATDTGWKHGNNLQNIVSGAKYNTVVWRRAIREAGGEQDVISRLVPHGANLTGVAGAFPISYLRDGSRISETYTQRCLAEGIQELCLKHGEEKTLITLDGLYGTFTGSIDELLMVVDVTLAS